MSIIKVSPTDQDVITIQSSPVRTYSSSSQGQGISGSIFLNARRSNADKELSPLGTLSGSTFSEVTPQTSFMNFSQAARDAVKNKTNFQAAAQQYLTTVTNEASTPTNQIKLEIIRFEPSFSYTNDTSRKLSIVNCLYPDYRVSYPTSNFAYNNYHCLNFVTGSKIPSQVALVYPNSASIARTDSISGSYVVGSDFTFEFYIKPKNHQKTKIKGDFKAGTILHLSSTYAVSLITGSSRDKNGLPNGYGLQLQLSHSADIPPSQASPGTGNSNLVFRTDDNSLLENHWHHVAIKWSSSQNNRTGSIQVDGSNKCRFPVPYSTIAPKPFVNNANPAALIVGNYFNATNGGNNSQISLFSNRSSTRDGLVDLSPAGSPLANAEGPIKRVFDHPLSAEVHEIRIFDLARTTLQLKRDRSQGISRSTDGLVFYLPPFFTRNSPKRTQIGETGGVLQTPFQGMDASTTDPFNISLSFGVGGHYLNLENFTQDFGTLNYPRLFNLTGSQINVTTQEISCNKFLYGTGSVRYRNFFMLPCDNGKLKPYFPAIAEIESKPTPAGRVHSGSSFYKYRDDLNNLDLGLINLRDLLPSSSYVNYIQDTFQVDEYGQVIEGVGLQVGAGFEEQVMGPSPTDMGVDPGEVLTIFQRTRDDTSNEICVFDISNLFYGSRIKPNTFSITDPSISGSFGKLGITLRDDGYGNIYRADANTEHAKWNSVGNIFYNEGIVLVKTPNIPFFGKDKFETTFRGEHEVHVLKTDIVAPAGMINSSSNINYKLLSSSIDANEANESFVAITGINFHDDNLNVIMRTKFAQPVIKRNSDKILFRTKLDF
jgi:hypothetical protein